MQHPVCALADHNSPAFLRGLYGSTDREKGREMGVIMAWAFGELLEDMRVPADASRFNISLSAEAMPLHYDGVSKVSGSVQAHNTWQLFLVLKHGSSPRRRGYARG